MSTVDLSAGNIDVVVVLDSEINTEEVKFDNKEFYVFIIDPVSRRSAMLPGGDADEPPGYGGSSSTDAVSGADCVEEWRITAQRN